MFSASVELEEIYEFEHLSKIPAVRIERMVNIFNEHVSLDSPLHPGFRLFRHVEKNKKKCDCSLSIVSQVEEKHCMLNVHDLLHVLI